MWIVNSSNTNWNCNILFNLKIIGDKNDRRN